MRNDFIYNKLQLLLEVLAKLHQSSGYIKNQEIGEMLGLSDRGVRRLIETLRDLGYNIEAKKGKDGGYRLLKGNLFLPVIIDQRYQLAWQEMVNYLQSSKGLSNYQAIMDLLNVIHLQSKQEQIPTLNIFEQFQMNPLIKQRIHQTHEVLSIAIKQRRRVIINYENASGKVSVDKVFIPYGIQIYNRAYYVKGHFYSDDVMRTLKLSRIQAITITDKHYVYDEKRDQLDMNQPFSDGFLKTIPVVLKIRQTRSDLKDYLYGEQQTIENHDDYFILKCLMKGEYVVINFVLSMGSDCVVLKPDWLKTKILEKINEIKMLY